MAGRRGRAGRMRGGFSRGGGGGGGGKGGQSKGLDASCDQLINRFKAAVAMLEKKECTVPLDLQDRVIALGEESSEDKAGWGGWGGSHSPVALQPQSWVRPSPSHYMLGHETFSPAGHILGSIQAVTPYSTRPNGPFGFMANLAFPRPQGSFHPQSHLNVLNGWGAWGGSIKRCDKLTAMVAAYRRNWRHLSKRQKKKAQRKMRKMAKVCARAERKRVKRESKNALPPELELDDAGMMDSFDTGFDAGMDDLDTGYDESLDAYDTGGGLSGGGASKLPLILGGLAVAGVLVAVVASR